MHPCCPSVPYTSSSGPFVPAHAPFVSAVDQGAHAVFTAVGIVVLFSRSKSAYPTRHRGLPNRRLSHAISPSGDSGVDEW